MAIQSLTLELIDHADQWIEDHLASIDNLIAYPTMSDITVELRERAQFVFGDEFDINA